MMSSGLCQPSCTACSVCTSAVETSTILRLPVFRSCGLLTDRELEIKEVDIHERFLGEEKGTHTMVWWPGMDNAIDFLVILLVLIILPIPIIILISLADPHLPHTVAEASSDHHSISVRLGGGCFLIWLKGRIVV